MQKRVSVIVPVYNSEAHIGQSLESVFFQTLETDAYEVICVDDCSSDGSRDLLEQMASTHRNLTVIRNDANHGVSAARNAGLAQATGDYVAFLDADDFMDPRLLETALAAADRFDADAAIYGFDEYYAASGSFVPRELFADEHLANRAFTLADLPGPVTELVTPNVWRILYRRAFLEGLGVRFHEDLATSEDLAFIYETLPFAKRICVVPERLYHYRRDGGQTLTRGERGLAGYKALSYAIAFAQEHAAPPSMLRHYVNIVADVAEYAMGSAATCHEYLELYEGYQTLWKQYVEEHKELVAPRYQRFIDAMRTQDASEYLFSLFASQRASGEDARSRLSSCEAELAANRQAAQEAREDAERVRASWAFKAGRAITFLPSKAKAALKGRG